MNNDDPLKPERYLECHNKPKYDRIYLASNAYGKEIVFVYQPERPLKSALLKISLDKRNGSGYRRVG
jgi:hypothetical protein